MIWPLHSVRDPDPFYSFHSFNTDSLSTCYILGIVPGLEDTALNKTEVPVLMELMFWWE